MHTPLPSSLLATLILLLASQVTAQDFFQQFFGGGGGGPQHHGPPQNAPSDAQRYAEMFDTTHCTNYLCPGTLACVSFPHHCPCAFPEVEDKVELGEGIAICASKGGYKVGEMARKVELARKGLL